MLSGHFYFWPPRQFDVPCNGLQGCQAAAMPRFLSPVSCPLLADHSYGHGMLHTMYGKPELWLKNASFIAF
jgi:hypothetical protein